MAAQEGPIFAHPVESALARILDEHGIAWEYEPHEFVLRQDGDGTVREALTPDFYLPEIGSLRRVHGHATVRDDAQEPQGSARTGAPRRRDLKRLGIWLHGPPELVEP